MQCRVQPCTCSPQPDNHQTAQQRPPVASFASLRYAFIPLRRFALFCEKQQPSGAALRFAPFAQINAARTPSLRPDERNGSSPAPSCRLQTQSKRPAVASAEPLLPSSPGSQQESACFTPSAYAHAATVPLRSTSSRFALQLQCATSASMTPILCYPLISRIMSTDLWRYRSLTSSLRPTPATTAEDNRQQRKSYRKAMKSCNAFAHALNRSVTPLAETQASGRAFALSRIGYSFTIILPLPWHCPSQFTLRFAPFCMQKLRRSTPAKATLRGGKAAATKHLASRTYGGCITWNYVK